MHKNKDDESLKIDKRTGIIWVIVIVVLIVGGEIAFLLALGML